MRQLSHIVNYWHQNPYTRKAKIENSLQELKSLLREQIANKVVFIPRYVLLSEIKKANKELERTRKEISSLECKQLDLFKPIGLS